MESSAPPFSILLVEDNKQAREIVANMVALKFPQYTIYTAENGKKGLELFREHTPDLVITDINMPEMDGIEMARAIKAINPNAKYIVLSARKDVKSVDKLKEIGYYAYMMKPLDFRVLFNAIKNCSHPEAEPPSSQDTTA
jgi:YesN/AraC family two-component response regulator